MLSNTKEDIIEKLCLELTQSGNSEIQQFLIHNFKLLNPKQLEELKDPILKLMNGCEVEVEETIANTLILY